MSSFRGAILTSGPFKGWTIAEVILLTHHFCSPRKVKQMSMEALAERRKALDEEEARIKALPDKLELS